MRTVRYVRNKQNVISQRLGPEKKKVLAKYPNLHYYRTKILSRRLLTFNYMIGLQTRNKQRPELPNYMMNKAPIPLSQKFDWRKKLNSVCIPRKYKQRPPRPPREGYNPNWLNKKEQDQEPETPEETYQRKKSVQRMRQDLTSSEVMEVMENMRVTAVTRENGAEFYQNRTTIYLESLRSAINCHDWILAGKTLEGLAEEIQPQLKYAVTWAGGFLAIVNLFPNNLARVKDFAELAKGYLMNFTLRLGVEVAAWFTQKGAFLDGYRFLQTEMQTTLNSVFYKRTEFLNNPKRKALDFIVVLHEAVYAYSCYKRDLKYSPEESDVDSLRLVGVNALNRFETLLCLTEELEFEVTIFVEPLIELMVELKSKEEARETFKKIVARNFGNGILDELYLKFLQKHFSFAKEEISVQQTKFTRYQFEINPKERIYHEKILAQYLEKKSVNNTQVPLKQFPKPSFCL